MADSRMPEDYYLLLVDYLPAEVTPGRQGGRPPISHRVALKAIWFVLVVGCRWRDVPQDLGCSGETARKRLRAWEQAGIWDDLHRLLLTLLNKRHRLKLDTAIIDSTQVRAVGGGDATGPSPVDRAKLGTKFTLLVDGDGVPLVMHAAAANSSDHREALPTIVDFPEVGGKPGRPRKGPDKLYADAGYDNNALRDILRFIGIEPHIRRIKGKHGSHLGRVRWVVERTISWLKGLRRMRVRFDRDQIVINAWTTMTIGVICFRIWNDVCTV